MKPIRHIYIVLVQFICTLAWGQNENQNSTTLNPLQNNATKKERPAANPADVSTIDALINATYHVISGPAGPRDWNRFLSLFTLDAKMGAVTKGQNAMAVFRSFTPEEYQKNNGPFFEKSPFYEEELKRTISQFGNIAHVQSSYQYRLSDKGKVEQRGINYFTLVNSNGRWWITNLIWQDEKNDLPLPKEFEKQ